MWQSMERCNVVCKSVQNIDAFLYPLEQVQYLRLNQIMDSLFSLA